MNYHSYLELTKILRCKNATKIGISFLYKKHCIYSLHTLICSSVLRGSIPIPYPMIMYLHIIASRIL